MKLIIYGTGLIAEVAAFYFERDSKYQVAAFTNAREFIAEASFNGKPIVAFEDLAASHTPAEHHAFIALGYKSTNQVRQARYAEAKAKGYTLATYISSRATYYDTPVGDNCFILENNVIQPFVKIGNNVTLWSGNHIGHHSTIRDHCFISSHVVVSGGCDIGENCFLGVNSTLRDNITLGRFVVVAAGATVLKNCEERTLVRPAESESKIINKNLIERGRPVLNIVWRKMGRIYVPPGDGFFKTHATRPIPFLRRDGTLRLFFSSRGADDMPYATFIDVDPDDPARVLSAGTEPMMPLGRMGTFDDSGVTPVSILRHGGEDRMYYVGWKRRRYGVTIETSIGLATLRCDGDELTRAFEGPILGQDIQHPILTAAPFVVFEDGRYRMWYCNGAEWRQAGGQGEMIYTVFYAESADGIRWTPHPGPVIPFKYDGEVVSAPWVVRAGGQYHMWYSTRGYATREAKNYTIGYAHSDDGILWERRDDLAGIERSESGWDSEMVCYPALHPHGQRVYMFYSGNGVGRGGIGYAVAENFLG